MISKKAGDQSIQLKIQSIIIKWHQIFVFVPEINLIYTLNKYSNLGMQQKTF